MNTCPVILKKRNRQTWGIALAFALITGSFVIFAFINTDAYVSIQYSYYFDIIGDFKVPGINETDYTPMNITFNRDHFKVSNIWASFDSQMTKLNKSEMIKMICESQRAINANNSHIKINGSDFEPYLNLPKYNVTLEHGANFINTKGDDYTTFRGKVMNFKVPKGNGLILIHIDFEPSGDIPNIFLSYIAYGIVGDDQADLKELGLDKTILTITDISFDPIAYNQFFDYVANRTDVLPINLPYIVGFDITKTPLTVLDLVGEG